MVEIYTGRANGKTELLNGEYVSLKDVRRVLVEWGAKYNAFGTRELMENISACAFTYPPSETSKIYGITLEDLDFTVRTFNCLKRAGFNKLGDIRGLTKEDLKKVRNLGTKSVAEIVEKLKEYGIEVKNDDEDCLQV
jgi:DNA-directed RNA polymerase alpha subunit